MALNRFTQKLYYTHPYLTRLQTSIVKTGPDVIELTATLAFPEGGGQDSDQGTITLDDGRMLRFVHASKMYGALAGLKGFPDLQVGGVIWHRIHPEDLHLIADIEPGMPATIEINAERRARLTLSHTASHLLYIGVMQTRQDARDSTLGCHIKETAARFDFGLAERFSAEDLDRISALANELVARDLPISLAAHPEVPDARTWHCSDHVIPCGGTHLERTGQIGPLTVRRKGLGAGKERITCEFPQARIDLGAYHA